MRTFILLAFILALFGCGAETTAPVIESVEIDESIVVEKQPKTYENVSAYQKRWTVIRVTLSLADRNIFMNSP